MMKKHTFLLIPVLLLCYLCKAQAPAGNSILADAKKLNLRFEMPTGFHFVTDTNYRKFICSEWYYTEGIRFGDISYIENEAKTICIGLRFAPVAVRLYQVMAKEFSKKVSEEDVFMATMGLNEADRSTVKSEIVEFPQQPEGEISGQYSMGCNLLLSNNYKLAKVLYIKVATQRLLHYFYFYDPDKVRLKKMNKIYKQTFKKILKNKKE